MKTKCKIAFLSRWGQSPAELLERFRKQTLRNSGIWTEKNITLFGVNDPQAADWTVVLGDYDPVVHRLDLKRTVYVQRELPANGYQPPPFHSSCARVLNYQNGYCLGIWWVEKPFYELLSLQMPTRNLKVGTIVTAKRETEGQRLRLDFLEKFSQLAPELVDIYGKDEAALRALFGPCYCGSLPYDGPNSRNGDKSAAIESYPLSFVFENCLQENYFSEKLLDTILLWSFPLYWGCPNLSDFFPYGSYARLDIGSPYFDYDELVQWILDEPRINLDAFTEARNRILWHHNLWAMLARLIESGHV